MLRKYERIKSNLKKEGSKERMRILASWMAMEDLEVLDRLSVRSMVVAVRGAVPSTKTDMAAYDSLNKSVPFHHVTKAGYDRLRHYRPVLVDT